MILPNLSHFETRTKRCYTFQINFFWCWLSWKGRIGWFLNPQHLFVFDSKWLKFGRIIAEHNLKLCWDPWHFWFKKRQVNIQSQYWNMGECHQYSLQLYKIDMLFWGKIRSESILFISYLLKHNNKDKQWLAVTKYLSL